MTPLYKREDTGEVVEMPFSAIWEQDELGRIRLEDGAYAKRCIRLEIERDGKAKRPEKAPEAEKPIVSDALGFCEEQWSDFEADRQAHGFSGVEFVRDKDVPQFYQVKISSRREWERYVKHRGMIDRNSRNGGGQPLTADQMRAAEERAKELWPDDGRLECRLDDHSLTNSPPSANNE